MDLSSGVKWLVRETSHLLPSCSRVENALEIIYTLSPRLLSKNMKIRIYKTIILPVVRYGCETWSLTLREEYRLRVFENRVLRRILGRKRDEVTGGWRKLHNEELHKLYSSPSKIRLRVFENRVLRRILGPKRDEVTGGWRKLRNEELHNLYSSPS
jgi:hypothetical protein